MCTFLLVSSSFPIAFGVISVLEGGPDCFSQASLSFHRSLYLCSESMFGNRKRFFRKVSMCQWILDFTIYHCRYLFNSIPYCRDLAHGWDTHFIVMENCRLLLCKSYTLRCRGSSPSLYQRFPHISYHCHYYCSEPYFIYRIILLTCPFVQYIVFPYPVSRVPNFT